MYPCVAVLSQFVNVIAKPLFDWGAVNQIRETNALPACIFGSKIGFDCGGSGYDGCEVRATDEGVIAIANDECAPFRHGSTALQQFVVKRSDKRPFRFFTQFRFLVRSHLRPLIVGVY